MGRVEIRAKIKGCSAAELFPAFADYESWPEYSDSIIEVIISPGEGDCLESSWRVKFHDGELRWTEVDVVDPEARRASFRQLEGDIDRFDGEWELVDDARGCQFRFAAEFDLGLPSLRDLLEPIAGQALRDNIKSVLRGLLSGAVEFEPSSPDAPPSSAAA